MAHQPLEHGVLSQGRAAVYEEPIGPPGVRIRERPRTKPSPGSVAVAIRAASIKHLDPWLAHGACRIAPPRVIAADGAGIVQESADPAWKAGDEVVIFPTLCDWECEWCRAGENVRCPRFGVLGEHSDGAACELIHIDARDVFRKPAGLTWEEAAAFPLTFLTAWRMLTTRARLRADETVLVIGAGAGVAVAAIQIAKHIGARVLVTSRSEAKRARALELGFFRHASLLGSTMGNASEFEALLKAMERGLRPVVDSVYPLDDVQAALTRLDAAEQFGKVVLSIST